MEKNKQKQILSSEEVNLIETDLEPKEIFLLGFLKGFNRKVTSEWADEGLWDFNYEILYEEGLSELSDESD